MQEEVTQKTIALSMKTGKLTAQALQAALKKYLQHRAKGPKLHHGKQSLKQLKAHGAALTNIEVTEANIGAFKPCAKKYGVDFTLRKDKTTQPPHYIVIFKAKDLPRGVCFHGAARPAAPRLPEAGQRAGHPALLHRHPGHPQPGASLSAGHVPQQPAGRVLRQLCGGAGHLLQTTDIPLPARQRHRAGNASPHQLQLRCRGAQTGTPALPDHPHPERRHHGSGHPWLSGGLGASHAALYLYPGDGGSRKSCSADHLPGLCGLRHLHHLFRRAGGSGQGHAVVGDLPVPLHRLHHAAGLGALPTVWPCGRLERVLGHGSALRHRFSLIVYKKSV